MQDHTCRLTRDTFDKVRTALLARVETLCTAKLSGRNLIQGLNEYAISLINYYAGIIDLEPEEYAALDQAVRQVLIKHRLHLQPACKERLYLPRNELGRGLHSIEHRSECMLSQLYGKLQAQRLTSTRRAAILALEKAAKSHLSLIRPYLVTKYKLAVEPTLEAIKGAQRAFLYSEINSRQLHAML